MTDKLKTPPSLREQIIDSITKHEGYGTSAREHAEILFDNAIMPVLQAAMEAGALLVGRNTKERIPVGVALLKWLEQVAGHVMMIRTEEATISRRQLLKIVYQFGDNAERALADTKKISEKEH